MNNIYYIKAHPHWPVGNAGAVVIAKNVKSAIELVDECGLFKAEEPRLIGKSILKKQVIFYNNGDY